MWRHSMFLMALFAGALTSSAQNGTAPSGYYPPTYNGSIFTGTLEVVDPHTQEITLNYSKGAKSERFVGRMESQCRWKEKGATVHTFKASDIPKDIVLTVFYITNTIKKSDGQKSKENSVFAISYVELNGKKIDEQKRLILSCSDQSFTVFKPY